VRDPDLWFPVAPGRDGKIFTCYRLPHSLLGVPALWLADVTGPVSEARRHFFFALIGPLAGAALALAYAIAFRRQGLSPRSALAWAAAGVFCTPVWYYSTTTFDDVLGSACAVGAVVCVWPGRRSVAATAAAGLLLGVALNCKQPLGLFALPVLAAAYDPGRPLRRQLARLALVPAGLALGLVTYKLFDWYRFPEGMDHGKFAFAPPIWGHAPLAALVALLVSPAAGALWYCPPLLLGLRGLALTGQTDRRFAAAVALTAAGFTAFVAALAFFKGDICWGPRYLTPVFALLWLATPAAAAAVRPSRVAVVLGLGLAVQLLALTADPHRLYARIGLQPKFLLYDVRLYYDLRTSHLFQRPLELWEVLTSPQPSEQFSPAPRPTYALPLPDVIVDEPDSIRRYHVFNCLRPWWACLGFLPPAERPVAILPTLGLLVALLGTGAVLCAVGLRRPHPGRRASPPPARAPVADLTAAP
jgi:hypothetical protein